MTTTKELARKLGLLRRRTFLNSDAHLSKKRSRTQRQTFAYLVVIDYESTCWQDDKFRAQEIIEFPAVLLNTSDGSIESEFHFYVQPQEQPILSDFCKQLTGITQEEVDNGIPISLCLSKFSRWLDKLQKEKKILFQQPSDDSVPYATFVTWSDWDLGTCLLNECKRKQILRPSQLNNWIDLRATYRKFYDRKPAGLNGALQDLGIQFEGREHSGLHDARNTANLAWRMMCDGCEMKITKNINRSTVPQYIRSTKQVSPTKSPCQKRYKLATNEQRLDSSCGKRVMEKSPNSRIPVLVKTRTPHKIQGNTIKCDLSKQIFTDQSSVEISEEPSNGKYQGSNHQKLKTRDNNIPSTFNSSVKCVNSKNQETELSLDCKKKFKGNFVSKNTEHSGKENSSSSFITPSPVNSRSISMVVNNSVNRQPCISKFVTPNLPTRVTPNSTPFSTPNLSSTNSMKGTPPLCLCGRRSKRRLVQSPGPNLGRFFFSCGFKGDGKKSGCGFFQWESSAGSMSKTTRHKSFTLGGASLGVSKPFTPVFNITADSVNCVQRRQLGVRPMSVLRPPKCIR